MGQKRLRAGVVGANSQNHLIERKGLGHQARCGAGRIILTLPDDFDRNSQLACPACVRFVREQQQGTT